MYGLGRLAWTDPAARRLLVELQADERVDFALVRRALAVADGQD